MAKQNVVKEKSYDFAVRIVNLVRYLQEQKKEYVLSKQVLRSGTSIGANVAEADAGQSKKDFIAKMSIASKEARETHYWLRLLSDTEYLEQKAAASILEDSEELIKLLTAILKTAQSNV